MYKFEKNFSVDIIKYLTACTDWEIFLLNKPWMPNSVLSLSVLILNEIWLHLDLRFTCSTLTNVNYICKTWIWRKNFMKDEVSRIIYCFQCFLLSPCTKSWFISRCSCVHIVAHLRTLQKMQEVSLTESSLQRGPVAWQARSSMRTWQVKAFSCVCVIAAVQPIFSFNLLHFRKLWKKTYWEHVRQGFHRRTFHKNCEFSRQLVE